MIALLLAVLAASADEAEIARQLKEKGVKVVETKGAVASIEVGDCSTWTDEEFKQVARLSRLKSLSFGPGLRDSSLSLLAGQRSGSRPVGRT